MSITGNEFLVMGNTKAAFLVVNLGASTIEIFSVLPLKITFVVMMCVSHAMELKRYIPAVELFLVVFPGLFLLIVFSVKAQTFYRTKFPKNNLKCWRKYIHGFTIGISQ